MSAKQIATLAGLIVQNQSVLKSLSSEDRQWAIENPKRFLFLAVREAANQRNPVRSGIAADLRYMYQLIAIEVDNDRSVTQMLKAGNYDHVDEEITDENLLNEGTGKTSTDLILFHRDKKECSQELVDELDLIGWRPIVNAELLAIGEQYPELQREFSIVALGQIERYSGHQYVPCLSGSNSWRLIEYVPFNFGWSRDCRFGFVRKDSEG